MSVFVDANIPMYAAGKDSPYKEPCRRVLAQIAAGQLDAVTDAEVFQEILYRYYHIKQLEVGRRIFTEFATLIDLVLPVRPEDLFETERLTRQYADIPPRDLLHAAVMCNNDIKIIVSADRDFDRLEDIERWEPLERFGL